MPLNNKSPSMLKSSQNQLTFEKEYNYTRKLKQMPNNIRIKYNFIIIIIIIIKYCELSKVRGNFQCYNKF